MEMNYSNTLKRLAKCEDGGQAVEAALLLALVAGIAGFGMLTLGDSLGNFFTDASTGFDPNDSFPLGTS